MLLPRFIKWLSFCIECWSMRCSVKITVEKYMYKVANCELLFQYFEDVKKQFLNEQPDTTKMA